MLNLPVPPQTRITRQLTCVSCQEKFTVAEDDPVRNLPRSRNWQSPTNNTPDIQLRYQENRTRRSVRPDSHTRPPYEPYETWNNESRETIVCPRCGADNRNWLNLLHPGNKQWSLLVWYDKFRPAAIGIIVSLFLVFTALVFGNFIGTPPQRNAILLLMIFLGAILPVQELTNTSHAQKLREDKHLRQIEYPVKSNRETVLWARGIFFFLLCTFIIPVILFWGTPRAIILFQRILGPTPQTVVENEAAPYINMLNEQLTGMPQDVETLTRTTINKLENIPNPWAYPSAVESILDEFNQELTEMLEDLSDSIQPDTLTQITGLKATVEQAFNEIEQVKNEEIQKALQETGSTLKFFTFWGLFVGLSTLISLFASMSALKEYSGYIDQQLPPPIFYSVANMTRVVVWEAKHALEIGDEVEQIQWTAVTRNEEGGINLQGLYYDAHQPHPSSDPLTTRILAQQYNIKSDRWGRIIKVNVKPARVLQRPQRSRPVEIPLGDELFSNIPNQPAEINGRTPPPRHS